MIKKLRQSLSALLLITCTGVVYGAQAQGRVILFGIDGMSPAGIAQANTPNMHALMKSGSWSMHARSVIPTVSSPNWAAMIMGAPTELTGVDSNDWQPNKHPIAPTCEATPGVFPTLYGLEHQQHPSVKIGVFTDWPDYIRLFEPGVASKVYSINEKEDDAFDHAMAYLAAEKPELLFIHLDNVDDAGHTYGWGSPQYLAAVEKVDDMLGRLQKTLDDLHLRDSTTLLMTADHGGIGKSHGGMTMQEIEIPWMITGPGVRKDHRIDTQILQFDTAATLAHVLKVTPSPCWRSQPVISAFTSRR
jgi:hypothetical protein